MKITNYIPVILCSIALCSCSDADKNIAFGLDSDACAVHPLGQLLKGAGEVLSLIHI